MTNIKLKISLSLTTLGAGAHVTYHAIERLKTECRKTRTKEITLANHSKRKQRQSDHGENTFEPVTNLNSRLNLQGLISN